MHNSRAPRGGRMGAGVPFPTRFQRGGQSVNNYHHQQQLPNRLMNNMPWQQQNVPNMANIPNMPPNINNYHMNQADNNMMPYQQHVENYANYVPTIQSLSMPTPDMIPNNQHVFQGYLPQNFVMQPQIIHGAVSPVENVMMNQPINITTPPPPPLQTPIANSSSPLQTPMINSPTNSLPAVLPVVKKSFDKFNSRENVLRCCRCDFVNHLAACELSNKDDQIARLEMQIDQLNNEIKYLMSQLQQERSTHSQPAITILQHHPNHNLVPKLSHLSPEAPEFRPDDHSVGYAPTIVDEVPVVSAKVMNEEPINEEPNHDVQVELEELTTEDNVKTKSEEVTEDIAPNETPPEEKAALNDDPELTSAETLEQPLDEVTEERRIIGNEYDAADNSPTADAVTEVQQNQNVYQEHVEESEQEEFLALTDSSSQIPESTDDDNNSVGDYQTAVAVSEPECYAGDRNSRPAYSYQSNNDYRRGGGRNRDGWDSRKPDQKFSSYSRGARGSNRTRTDSFNSDKSQQNMPPNRGYNNFQNFTGRYHNKRNKYGDDSQDRKSHRDSSRDSYQDAVPKERNGQPDHRGKPWDMRGNSHKTANNNNQLLNWGDDYKHSQGKSGDNSYGRDPLTELKTKSSSAVSRSNDRRGHNKQYIITELKADLFTAPDDFALAHCVAKDFRMGSGIAFKFKSEFKRVAELLDQNVDVGGCAYIKHEDRRYIFYLVTKEVSCGKPTMATMQQSLEALKEKCQMFGVNKLAIPHIGCGLDKLIWSQVRALISEVFCDTGIVINAYDFNVVSMLVSVKHVNNNKVYGNIPMLHVVWCGSSR